MISSKAIISANVRYHHKSEDSVGTQESGERERDMTSHRPQLMASLSASLLPLQWARAGAVSPFVISLFVRKTTTS